MRIDDQLKHVDEQLAAAAALGDERTQQIATALSAAVTPAVRLAIMSALSVAADEITAALLDSPGAPVVSAQLDGSDIRIDVRVTNDSQETAAMSADDGDTSARISLRLSESLKTDIDTAARRDGVSVNTWLVRAATRGLAAPSAAAHLSAAWAESRRQHGNTHRMTGWING